MTAVDPDKPVVELDGGFRAFKVLGKGTFATVFYGTGPDGSPVAIKVPHRKDEQALRRFLREIKVMRSLPRSRHTVGYRGHGRLDDGIPWLAMEYVNGVTLRRVVGSGKAMPERAACALMHQLCEGFAGLHKLGLAHRDIKPDNIMITREERRVKLMDFGLVQDSQGLLKLFEEEDILQGRDFADDIDQGMLAGTPEFMAPEQITDPRQSDRSLLKTDTTADVYSLGVIFYVLLTTRKPFPFHPKSKTMRSYQREVLAYLEARLDAGDEDLTRPPEIGEALWSIIGKALRRDPKMRQGDARILGADIEHYLRTGEGIQEDDVSTTMALDMNAIPELAALAAQVESSGMSALSVPVAKARAAADEAREQAARAEPPARRESPPPRATLAPHAHARQSPDGPRPKRQTMVVHRVPDDVGARPEPAAQAAPAPPTPRGLHPAAIVVIVTLLVASLTFGALVAFGVI